MTTRPFIFSSDDPLFVFHFSLFICLFLQTIVNYWYAILIKNMADDRNPKGAEDERQYTFVANKEKNVSMFPATTEPAALFLQEK